jgi:hypothetical protein
VEDREEWIEVDSAMDKGYRVLGEEMSMDVDDRRGRIISRRAAGSKPGTRSRSLSNVALYDSFKAGRECR